MDGLSRNQFNEWGHDYLSKINTGSKILQLSIYGNIGLKWAINLNQLQWGYQEGEKGILMLPEL